jgi:hypothetical protein
MLNETDKCLKVLFCERWGTSKPDAHGLSRQMR